MNDACHLCGNAAVLQHSHIIPAFIFRWLREGGHIRSADRVNQRVQDGFKEYWLCSRCEQLFSKFETWFARNVFYPYVDRDNPKIPYGPHLLRFCVSLSWRVLKHLDENGATEELSSGHRLSVRDALSTWSSFLEGEASHPGRYEQHLLPFTEILSHPAPQKLPPNINRYLLRAVELDLGHNEESIFVFSKIGRFAVIGFVNISEPRSWSGSRVAVKGGCIHRDKIRVPNVIWEYLMDRAFRTWRYAGSLSDPQQAKVDAYFKSNVDRIANSDLIRAVERDVRLFGRAAFFDRTGRKQ